MHACARACVGVYARVRVCLHVRSSCVCVRGCGGHAWQAMDVLRLKDGSDVVLEMNDTACGLMYEHEHEDNGHIRDLVVARMVAAPKAAVVAEDGLDCTAANTRHA